MKFAIYMQTWNVGGVASFCGRLAWGLHGLGISPVLVLATPYGKRDAAGRVAFEQLADTTAFPVHCLHLSAFHPKERGWRAADQIAEMKCDAVFLSSHRSILGALPGLASRTVLIGIAHNDDEDTYTEFQSSEHYCAAYVGVSTAITERLKIMGRCRSDDVVRYIPYGVPSEQTFDNTVPTGPARVLVASRLVQHQKRILDLPLIWREYRRLGGDGTLTICGPGEEEEQLRVLLADEIKTGAVRVLGAVSLSRMAEIYAQHDILLSVSSFEGLPITVLEAVSMGLFPLLSRTRSGHPEIIECLKEGRFCSVGDIQGFAFSLNELGSQIQRMRLMRPLLRERARLSFGLSRMVSAYAELASQLIRKFTFAENGAPWLSLPRPKVDRFRSLLRHWQYSRHYGWQDDPARRMIP